MSCVDKKEQSKKYSMSSFKMTPRMLYGWDNWMKRQ